MPHKMSGEMEREVIGESANFATRDFSLRAQKKLLSKMSGPTMSRMFIDNNTSRLLDSLYLIAKKYTNDKKESEKLIKNIIKTVIKFSILFRKDILTDAQQDSILDIKDKVRILAMNIMTFHEMDFTYDRAFLTSCLRECQISIVEIAEHHLTTNNVQRIIKVFEFFNNEQFLDELFAFNSEYKPLLGNLVKDLHRAIDEKIL